MEIEQESDDGVLEKLTIIGSAKELQRLAFLAMDAIDTGESENEVGDTLLTLRCE